jgi:hypothetical protein
MFLDRLVVRIGRHRIRGWGALLGLLVGAAFAGTGTSLFAGLGFLWLGVPVAGLLGWRFGPAAAAERPCTAIRMAWGCTVYGAILTGLLLSSSVTSNGVQVGLDGLPSMVLAGIGFGVIGIAFFGIPSLLILWPIALFWVSLVRRIAGHGAGIGKRKAPAEPGPQARTGGIGLVAAAGLGR